MSSTAERTAPGQNPSYFGRFPGEIRNQIFSLCISHALADQKPWRATLRSQPPPNTKITVTVLSRRNGNGHLKIEGIGPLPLLVVNKQIYAEVSSLVFALVDHVSIGSNMYLDEDPNERWEEVYRLVQQRPDIQKLAKTVKVVLPRTPDDLLRTTYDSLKKIRTNKQTPRKSNAMAIIPELAKFLGRFESLTSVTIVMIEDRREPPTFEDLLPLKAKYGERMRVRFEKRREGAVSRFTGVMGFLGTWTDVWEKCVREYEEKAVVESGVSDE